MKRNYYIQNKIKEQTPLKIDSKRRIIYVPYGLRLRGNAKNLKRFHKWKSKLQNLDYTFQFEIPS